MGRKPNYLAASIFIGAGAIIGDAALDNIEYVRETLTDSRSYHSDNDSVKKLNVSLMDDVRDSLLWGFGELVVAAPLIAFGIGQATGASRRREE
jgi:hypothetical protein